MSQVVIDPVVKGEDGAIMRHIEERLNRFENKNTWWRHSVNGTMDEFDRLYEEAAARIEAQLGKEIPLVINGEEITVGSTFEVTSPADTSKVVGVYQNGTRQHVQDAIAASKAGFEAWSRRPWQERAELIEKASAIMSDRFYDGCAIMTWETGKTRFESSIDVDEGIDFGNFYAMNYREHSGYNMLMGKPFPNETCTSIRKPVGVFGVVCPFNFPIAITFGMAAAALLTGNAAIIKPSTKGVLSGWFVFECLRDAGIPSDVLHFITGPDEEVSAELLENPGIDGLVFTGSKRIGMMAMQKIIEHGQPKPFIAEMGGKNAVLITKNADLDKAVQGVFKSAFGFSGQKCSACSRVYVHKDVAQEFKERLVKLTAAAQLGHPREKETFMGPVIEARKIELYNDVVENVKRDGGQVLHGGNVRSEMGGHYLEPTIVTGLPKDHRVFREEFFMPFVAICEVDSLEEAVHEYNQVEYGLTAGVMTEDEDEQAYFFDNVQSGVTYCNRAIGGSTGAVVNGQSFVGWKLSGSTGTGAGGRYYLLQFTRERSQTVA
ncbi:MAG: aldehyde dehydrogenase family protein [Thermoplasmatota archaeon]